MPRNRRNPTFRGSDVSRAAIPRVARQGGVKRLSSHLYNEGPRLLNDFVRDVLRKAQVLADHSKRKTVSGADVVQAVRRSGVIYYG